MSVALDYRDSSLEIRNRYVCQYSFRALYVPSSSLPSLCYVSSDDGISDRQLKEYGHAYFNQSSHGVTETDTQGYLEFDNVTFAYPGETEKVSAA